MHTNIGVAPIQFYEFLIVECCNFFKYAFSPITHRILHLHNRNTKIFAFDIFGIKCCLHPYMTC